MVHFKINGKEKSFEGDPEMPLLWYLRDIAGFTGTSLAAAWRFVELVPCIRMAMPCALVRWR